MKFLALVAAMVVALVITQVHDVKGFPVEGESETDFFNRVDKEKEEDVDPFTFPETNWFEYEWQVEPDEDEEKEKKSLSDSV